MNLSIRAPDETVPLARQLMDQALAPHVLVGMPHLTPAGLSETWLMKELGHRHWLLLARRMNMDNADFRTADGSAAYAAICATSLSSARLGGVAANSVLTIQSSLTPLSRTGMSSRHSLYCEGIAIGEVELVSTFVTHGRQGDNHSIVRIDVPGAGQAGPPNASALADAAKTWRGVGTASRPDLSAAQAQPLACFKFMPDPLLEFNGAGLLYFAQFQAIVERAHENWFGNGQPRSSVTDRTVFFSGNARSGEALTVELMTATDRHRSTHCRIRRAAGQVIADMFTARG